MNDVKQTIQDLVGYLKEIHNIASEANIDLDLHKLDFTQRIEKPVDFAISQFNTIIGVCEKWLGENWREWVDEEIEDVAATADTDSKLTILPEHNRITDANLLRVKRI